MDAFHVRVLRTWGGSLLVGALATACLTEEKVESTTRAVDLSVGTDDCGAVATPLAGPFVMPTVAGHGLLRWEGTESDAPVACVEWTAPGNATYEMAVSSIVVPREAPPLDTAAEDTVARIYSAGVTMIAAGDYRWKLDTADGPVQGSFEMAAADEPATVFVLGDTNNTNEATRPTPGGGEETVDITAQLIADHAPEALHMYLHLGDMAYNASVPIDNWGNFWSVNRELMRRSVFLPVVGNHEYEFASEYSDYVATTFSRPGQEPGVAEVLVADMGPMRMVTFNSNRDRLSDAQKAAMWDAVDAALAGAGDRWTVLIMHHPIYTRSEHAPIQEIQAKAIELDTKHDINLVLTGHNHVYERFTPSHFHNIVSGGGGAFLYGLESNDPIPGAPRAASAAAYHAVELTAHPDRIEVIAVDLAGNEIDRATLAKR